MSLRRSKNVEIVEDTSEYPDQAELIRLMRLTGPDVVFLSLKNERLALETGQRVAEFEPGLPIVPFGRRGKEKLLLDLMKLGVREVLSPPFSDEDIEGLVGRLRQLLVQLPPRLLKTGLMFSFLPAKPGVGASTIALNTSIALSRHSGVRALLADFDLTGGLIAFMLKIGSAFSLMDMVHRSREFDDDVWYKLISRRGDLDILASGRPAPGMRVESIRTDEFLNITRRLYDFVCADLSGGMESFSEELLTESDRIFLVCTPEVPALHLARERYCVLESLGLASRVSVILNRWDDRQSITRSEVEKMLNVPIFETLPNDYHAVHTALMAGREVNSNCKLSQRFEDLANRLLHPGAATQESRSEPGFLSSVTRRIFGAKHEEHEEERLSA